jgi:hypothetical protein
MDLAHKRARRVRTPAIAGRVRNHSPSPRLVSILSFLTSLAAMEL